ncbi:MAG: enoyl-CoA hydratase/isomerase family protein [Gammaproteobacteria bacterium]|nr:enoyl-CoA hydratase/isomerase family protein [Gammaproteobacteria bacterium]
MTTLVQHHVENATGWILLNNTAKKNALRLEMYDEIFKAIDNFEADDAVRVIVIKGQGGNFSSGFDITQGSPEPYRDFVKNVSSKVSKRLWYSPKPTISVIEGYCVGGGFELAMGSDLVYASTDAELGEPEIDFFYIPDFSSIPFITMPRKAKEMIMLGLMVSGKEAADIGLINRAFPAESLMHEVDTVCQRIVSLPSQTMAMAKVALNGALDLQGFAQSINHGEEIAALNSEANKSNADCQAFHQEVEEHGIKAALNMVRGQGIWKG